jgi:type IV pilus assembly protein PilV
MTTIDFHPSQPSPLQRGFSMVEVLITIVIMAFGLLGISGLMVKGIDNATGSDLSSRATQAANQIIDAIKASDTTTLEIYNVDLGDNASKFSSGTTQQDRDRSQWLTTLSRLPGGDGSVGCSSTTRLCTITVQFRNCIGTLSGAEQTACAGNVGNIRTLRFVSQI